MTDAGTVLSEATLDVIRRVPPVRALAKLGMLTRRAIEGVGRSAHFAVTTLGAVRDVGTWGPLATLQMRRVGVGSLPIALFIAVFTGIVL